MSAVGKGSLWSTELVTEIKTNKLLHWLVQHPGLYLVIYIQTYTRRFLRTSSCEWVFMKHLVGEHNLFKVLLGNQVTLHVFKNKALVSNIRAGRKASIGGIDGSQTGMSTFQV